MRPTFRPEVMVIETKDGGLDLFDLLYERIEHLSPAEVHALSHSDPDLIARLDALVLFEGEHAETLRMQRYARHKVEITPQRAPEIDEVDWQLARQWPDFINAMWRDPEALRRLAESRASGNTFLTLPSFLTQQSARELALSLASAPFEVMNTPWVRGGRHVVCEGSPGARWIAFLRDEVTRTLFSGVLGHTLGEATIANAWRLRQGDSMPVHPDGRRYHGTASLGLSEGWRASQGGAIAMGTPEGDRFMVNARWLPQLGDLLLFAPSHDTWHAVEPVLSGERLSLTAWWMES